MDGTANDADVVLNRLNVALARSQRIINSWLPQRSPEEEQEPIQTQDDDEDFRPMAEEAGIGSQLAYDGDASPNRPLQRKKLASNDKLLEQLLGKKAAHAHRKSQETRKNMSSAKHAAPKPLVSRPKPSREAGSEDEDEAGRSAAFKSRKLHRGEKRRGDHYRALDRREDDEPAVEDTSDTAVTGIVQNGDLSSSKNVEQEKQTVRKSNTYLDELLSQKARKRKKRKQN